MLWKLVFTFMVVLCANSYCLDINTNQEPLLRGLSIQIGVTDLFHFYGYEGALVSAKLHINPHNAIRLGISMNYGANEYSDITTNVQVSSQNYQMIVTSNSTPNNSISMGINLDYLYYINPESELKAFVGLGPTVGYSYGKQDQCYYYGDSTTTNSTINTTWSVGGRFILGLEWFITKNFSLVTEYGLAAYYSHTSRSIENHQDFQNGDYIKSTDNIPSDTISINPMSFKFGISAYF